MNGIRQKAVEGLRPGDEFVTTRTFTEEDMRRFGDVTLDYNPVHYDERFARARGFRDRICHGLLVGGLLTEIGGQIGWLATEMNFRFIRPVFFGDTITCRFTISRVEEGGQAEARVTYRNQHGEAVLSATLRGILPGRGETEILRTMLSEGDPTNPLRG